MFSAFHLFRAADCRRFALQELFDSRHRLGGIPLPGARRLRDRAIDDKCIAVVHEHMAPVARKSRVSVGLAGQ